MFLSRNRPCTQSPRSSARDAWARPVQFVTDMATRISTAEARKNQAQVLRTVMAGGRVKITRYDQTIGVIVPKKDLQKLEDCERAREEPRPQRRRRASDAQR